MNRFIFFLCLLLPITSFAEVSFEQLNKVVSSPDVLKGHFTQEKYLSELDTTLSSSGIFNYQRDLSIHWETTEPIQNVLMMTPKSIINMQGEHEVVRMEAKSNPTVSIVSDIFFSVLTADWGTLSNYFTLSGSINEQQWDVELIPIDKTMLQIMSRVTLKGDSLLRELSFYEKNGDYTTIQFDELIQ